MTKKLLLSLGLTATALTSTGQAALIANWTLEEGSGNTTTELVSSTDSADFSANPTWSPTAGAPGNSNSLDFNNTGGLDTNLTATDIGFAGSGAKTIVTWFNTTTTAEDSFFGYSPTSGGGAGKDLRFLVKNGGLRMEVSFGGFEIGSGLNDGNWHMVAFIINANDGIDDVDVYIDGAYTTRSSGGTLINTAGTGKNVLIGTDGNVDRHFDGLIDQVQIYDTALSVGELNAIAVPEPSSAALLGLGGVALILRRRRK